jgi:hypothetical protein
VHEFLVHVPFSRVTVISRFTSSSKRNFRHHSRTSTGQVTIDIESFGIISATGCDLIPGFEVALQQSNVTYHLEVKTTFGAITTPALLSNNQISMAKRYSSRLVSSDTQTNVYILVRVYDLASEPCRPQFCLFPDPWELICKDLLQIGGDTGIYVRPRTSELAPRAQSTTMRDMISYINDA